MSWALGIRLDVFVEPMAWEPKHGTVLSWPFKLDAANDQAKSSGGSSRAVLRFKRPEGYCAHLVRPGQATSRCGVYELRPAICRLYPFVLEDDDERFSVGSQEGCPQQWLQNRETVDRASEAIAGLRKERALDLQIVRAWNRGIRARTFEGLIDFLEDGAANALGHDVTRLPRFSS